MASHIIELTYNLAILVALSVTSGFILQRGERRAVRAVLQGVLFGAAAIIGMMRPVVFGPGLIFDGRSVMISLCGLFFGPVAAGTAAGMALLYRVPLGGVGAVMGVLVIASSAMFGVVFHGRWVRREVPLTAARLWAFGLLVHVTMVLLMFTLPAGACLRVIQQLGLPVLLAYPLATLLIGKLLAGQEAAIRSREALRVSEARYRSILHGSPDAITLTDLSGRIVMASPASLRLFGCEREEEQLGQPLSAFIAPNAADRDASTVALTFPAAMAGPGEYRGLRRDGSSFGVETNGEFILDARGKPTGVVFITRDICERKRAEAQRAKLEAQLQQSQKMESVGRLAGGVAHDFNNMLTVILGNTELAIRVVGPEMAERAGLDAVHEAATRSVELTRALLAFARKQPIAPKVLNLATALDGMLKMLRRLIGDGVELHWEPGVDLWPVELDPSQLDQILINLCVNAKDAISGVGKVTIATANCTLGEAFCAAHPGFVRGEYVRLAVTDDGRGMDEEVLEHLFEPFFTTKEPGKGTGLGLATVYGIVKQNKAFIEVRSAPGAGTTFTIYLPRYVKA